MLHKTIEERLQDWIDRDKALLRGYVKVIGLGDDYDDKNISLKLIVDDEECIEKYSIYDIFFGPSNYWEVMFPEDGTTYATETLTRGNEGRISRNGYKNKTNEFHQIQCLIHTQNGGTIESYLDDNLE